MNETTKVFLRGDGTNFAATFTPASQSEKHRASQRLKSKQVMVLLASLHRTWSINLNFTTIKLLYNCLMFTKSVMSEWPQIVHKYKKRVH